LVHVETGILQLTGTGNSYSGGTKLETGTTLVAGTATLSSAANQTITNAGGTLVLDQTTNGNLTAVMTDGQAAGQGPTLSGSLVKADSTGSNGGNVTISQAQQYSGATTVEAGTLTLGGANAVAASSGVTLGTVGGGATANLALGANNTVQGLNSIAGNTTGVQLNGKTLTVQQASGTTSGFGGNITDTGAGNLTTTGTGTVALSGANSIGGNLNVGPGTFSQTGGSLTVGGNVTNNGTMSVSATTAFYDGTFTNNGLLTSDPSTQTFNNLAITATGAIQAAQGDLYKVSGEFTNASTLNTIWNTKGAGLAFISGASTSHTMQLAGSDLGASAAGYQNNFAWGSLTIDAGNTLALTGDAGSAFYTDDIIGVLLNGDTVTNIDGDGLDIYYDPYDAATAYLNGLTYDLTDGGQLIADVPEPASFALLLTGLAGGIVVRRRKRA
jgi:fibronectin-binding autotransporter adhesin